jgi:hypothetical protein
VRILKRLKSAAKFTSKFTCRLEALTAILVNPVLPGEFYEIFADAHF